MFFIKLNRVQVQFSSYLYSWKINLKIKQFTAAGQLLFCIFNVQFINILMSIMVIIFTLQFCTNDIALKIVIINSLRPVDLYCVLTLRAPLMSTLSANLTRLGCDLSFAFLAAERSADFRLELCK